MTSPSSSSTGSPESAGCFSAVKALLDRLEVGWALAGAYAAMRYGATPRETTDVDFLVEWHDGLVSSLVDDGFDVRTAKDEGEVHLVRTRRSDGAADLLIARTEYQMLAIHRAVDHVLTVEDVFVHKVIAWRPRDREDIRSILRSGIEFDRSYVDRWTTEWGFEDRWTEAQTWS